MTSENTRLMSTKTQVKNESQVKTPRFFCIVMINDDFTTVDFVVEVLCTIFSKTVDDAQRIAMTIHNEGRATIVEGCSRDWAETKAQQSNTYARKHGHPLLCEAQPMS